MPLIVCVTHGDHWSNESRECVRCQIAGVHADEHADTLTRTLAVPEHGVWIGDRGPLCLCGWAGLNLTLTENVDAAADHARLNGGRMLDPDEQPDPVRLFTVTVCELCCQPCEGVRCPRCETLDAA